MDYYHDHQDLDHFLSSDQLDDHSSLINLSDHGSDHHQIPGHSTPSSSITDLIKYPYHNYYVHPNCYSSDDHDLNPTNFQEEGSHVSGSEPDDTGSTKIAFRTRTQLETLDDGFKWRKYGKKMVKNSPYPRNYYKCSSRECSVKKRVERDSEDSSMLITTYQGRHNHQSPSAQ